MDPGESHVGCQELFWDDDANFPIAHSHYKQLDTSCVLEEQEL